MKHLLIIAVALILSTIGIGCVNSYGDSGKIVVITFYSNTGSIIQQWENCDHLLIYDGGIAFKNKGEPIYISGIFSVTNK